MGLADMERQEFIPPSREEMEAAPPGSRHITFFPTDGVLSSFLSGDPQSMAVRVSYFLRESDGILLARAWFGPGAKGPPGHAHGGSIAALLDEAMGCCAWHTGHPVLAARIEVAFRHSLPLGRVYMVEAWVERASGRKFTLQGRLRGQDGVLYAESEGLFLELNDELKEAMAEYREEMNYPDGVLA